MRLTTGLLMAGLLTMAGLANAAEPEKPKEASPSPELVVCQQKLEIVNEVLQTLAGGIQREMESTGLRLEAKMKRLTTPSPVAGK